LRSLQRMIDWKDPRFSQSYGFAGRKPVIARPSSCSFLTTSPAAVASSALARILTLQSVVLFPQGQVLVLESFGA